MGPKLTTHESGRMSPHCITPIVTATAVPATTTGNFTIRSARRRGHRRRSRCATLRHCAGVKAAARSSSRVSAGRGGRYPFLCRPGFCVDAGFADSDPGLESPATATSAIRPNRRPDPAAARTITEVDCSFSPASLFSHMMSVISALARRPPTRQPPSTKRRRRGDDFRDFPAVPPDASTDVPTGSLPLGPSSTKVRPPRPSRCTPGTGRDPV